MAPLPPNAPVGIYVHVPFCAHICPYCDFNTYRGMEALIPHYVRALQTEIAHFPDTYGTLNASTIYFGGGTPSLLPASEVDSLIHILRDEFDLAVDAEITLEANPNSVDEQYFSDLLTAGAQPAQHRHTDL